MTRLLLIAILLLSASCGDKLLYTETVVIDEVGWHKDKPVEFDVVISDTLTAVNVGMTFTHSNDYPYANIWLFMEITSDYGLSVVDTLDFFLAEPDGRWLGRKKGGEYVVSALYKHAVTMSRPGNYKFSITQGMRSDILPEIREFEFWISESK